MAASLVELSAEPQPEGLSIVPCAGEDGMNEWSETFCAAFEAPAFAGEAWVEASSRCEFGPMPWLPLLGRLDGRPVAVALAFLGQSRDGGQAQP